MRHLLTGFEFSTDEYLKVLELAKDMKENPAKYATKSMQQIWPERQLLHYLKSLHYALE